MAATRSSIETALLRGWRAKQYVEQLYEENRFLDKVKKTDRFLEGEKIRVPLHVSRNGGFTSLPAGGGNLNEAGNQGYNKAEYNLTHHHQQVALQGDVIDTTKTNSQAIVSAYDEEIKRALNDMNRQLSRMLYLNGDGLITKCRTSESNNVDLDKTTGLEAIERGWLFVGQPIDVGTAAEEHSKVDGSKITAIDEANVALTVASGNVTGETSSYFVSQKDARSGETSYEMNGLRKIVSATSTLGGLSPETEVTWKSTVSTATSLTVNALLEAQQKIRQKRGKSPNFFLTGLKQRRKFYELLEQQVQFPQDKVEAGNDETARWAGMEIFADPDCPDSDLYLGHFDHFFITALPKPYWQNEITGGQILDWIQGTDSYGGKLTYRMNACVDRRNDLYRFSSLT
jgi:hypothetical protein